VPVSSLVISSRTRLTSKTRARSGRFAISITDVSTNESLSAGVASAGLVTVHAQLVVIYVVADGRRDMQSLLMRRLLGA